MASSGSTSLQSADDALRPQRRAVESSKCGRMNASHSARQPCDRRVPRREVRRIDVAPLRQQAEQLAHEHLRVGDDAERRRIVAADLLRVDVDVDQLRRREIPRVARDPATTTSGRRSARRPRSAGRVPARLVGRIGAVAADEAERERIAAGTQPMPFGEVMTGMLASARTR